MPLVRKSLEKKRGCGYRKNGYYLIGGARSTPCCSLPLPLEPCRCCGHEIQFTRGFQWIKTTIFRQAAPQCSKEFTGKFFPELSLPCPLAKISEKIGLMWVGAEHYPTPADFIKEADQMQVSKRIGVIPKECKIGTWVALAHPGAIYDAHWTNDNKPAPGIFMVFRITRVDYVIRGDEAQSELERIEAEFEIDHSGTELTFVKVEKEEDPTKLFDPLQE